MMIQLESKLQSDRPIPELIEYEASDNLQIQTKTNPRISNVKIVNNVGMQIASNDVLK